MKFFIAFLGWLTFTAFAFRYSKDQLDDKNETLSFRDYLKKNYDNWATTFCAVLILGFLDVEVGIMLLVNKWFATDLEWNRALFLIGPVGIEGLFFIYKKWRKSKEKEA